MAQNYLYRKEKQMITLSNLPHSRKASLVDAPFLICSFASRKYNCYHSLYTFMYAVQYNDNNNKKKKYSSTLRLAHENELDGVESLYNIIS